MRYKAGLVCRDFREHGIDAVQAGAGHETDIKIGLIGKIGNQSSAAMLVPRKSAKR